MPTEHPRFSITVSEKMYDQINRFQHENRFKTQTKAIAEILRIGLKSLEEEHNALMETTEPIRNLSIHEQLSKIYGPEVIQAINLFDKLDMLDRGRIIGNMENMLGSEKYSIQEEVKHA